MSWSFISADAQASTAVSVFTGAALFKVYVPPTAHTELLFGIAAIELNPSSLAPATSTVFCTSHFAPFHLMPNVFAVPPEPYTWPTAHTAFADSAVAA